MHGLRCTRWLFSFGLSFGQDGAHHYLQIWRRNIYKLASATLSLAAASHGVGCVGALGLLLEEQTFHLAWQGLQVRSSSLKLSRKLSIVNTCERASAV